MSLYTRRDRVDVSTSDSEINSVASSGVQSPDEVVEELARMALAGHYCGNPMTYETNQMLRGHGLARRPGASEITAAGPSPPLTAKQPPRGGTTAALHSLSSHVSPQRTPFYPRRLTPRAGTMTPTVEPEMADDVSRALGRMYRHLAREYAAEMQKEAADATAAAASTGGGGAGKNDSDDEVAAADPPKKPKQRQKSTSPALTRLLAKSKVQELRQTEKYHKIKDRAEEARKHPKRIHVSQKAVELGRRLYLGAQEQRRILKEMQDEQEKKAATEERKACTFQPSISRYAERLASSGAYCTLEDRLEDQAVYDEERQRLRFERAVESEKECTFRPALSVGTEQLIARQRRRHSQRRRKSRSRSRSRSHRGRNSSARTLPSHEPFDPGERLYRDGAERLLRQQIRLRRAAAKQQRHVVGGQLRLSAEKADDLAHRFDTWAVSREQRQAQLRDAVERETRDGSHAASRRTGEEAAGATRGLNRSPSAKSASTARPKSSPFVSRGDQEGEGEGDSHSTTRTSLRAPPLPSDSLAPAASRASAHGVNGHNNRAAPEATAIGVVPLRFFATAGSTKPHSGADSSTQGDSSTEALSLDPAARKAQLRIRLGALFYKYAVAPTSSTVSLAEVKHQVSCYYPEDWGVAAALSSSFDDEQQRLPKNEFMAALARYIAQNGPQPWCMPQQRRRDGGNGHPHGSPTPTSDKSYAPAATAAAARGDFLERLNAPTSSLGSSAKEEQTSAAAAAATRLQAAIGSAGSSHVDVPSSRSATPTDSVRQAGVGILPRNGGQGREGSLSAEVAPASSLAVDHKPLRTHIYHRSRGIAGSSGSPAPGRQATETPVEVTPTNGPNVDSTGGLTAPHSASADTATRPKEQRSAPRTASPEKGPAAQLVQGYQGHVQRHRRSMTGIKSGVESAGSGERDENCTFQPTLNRRSVELSSVNLEKRLLYARELQLRRQQLQMLRASVLKAADDDYSVASCSRAPASPGSATNNAAASSTPRAANLKTRGARRAGLPKSARTPPKPQLTPPRASSGDGGDVSSAAQVRSPSINVSSLSSTTAAGEHSGATVSNRPSPARKGPCPTEELKSFTLAGPLDPQSPTRLSTNGAGETPSDSAAVVPAASRFRATKPDKAVLAADDVVTPRHAARRQQNLNRTAP
ncbi:hypothetical protein ABB37_00644 [Leptomonas pyrrhocoris]|uniref:Uncharacterized protein n=1 Tax=Leptomonas pyrrhocoris TaxID=157538 RepID=A0A0M9GB64_LEPPY|nr:hypothetical protein ABB37_00644 [Leptomonas pyrrhocoris]KPA86496.1 hypothetical protein ABB37_00644 [Leptomonas pyrrhocoris]|eukprot:XP_015664935.1 hypothetical protein ABB37_00644 [Leptomonas pyrrhocoris]